MERQRTYSGGWSRPNPQRVATVKPVSKSLSAEDLNMEKSADTENILKRFKSQDLAELQKDSLIEELEKCLGELETEHKTSLRLNQVYETVEAERNQLLDELELAFQDLREYMRRQTMVEEQKALIEEERDELAKENAYLKEVLSNRSEIMDRRVTISGDEKRKVQERVTDLERKNAELVGEINSLYEERQTLIASLVGLRSEQVDSVLRQRSRSGSFSSTSSSQRDCAELPIRLGEAEETIAELRRELEQARALLVDARKDNEDLTMAFGKLRSLDSFADVSSADDWGKKLAEKDMELQSLRKEFADQKLLISKMNNEKRGFQRQIDHLREETRRQAALRESAKKESENTTSKLRDAEKSRRASEKEAQKLQQQVDELSAKMRLHELDMRELQANKEVDKVESDLERENRALVVRLEGMGAECSSLRERYKELGSEFARLQVEHERVNSENGCFVVELSNLRTELVTALESKQALESDLNTVRQEMEVGKQSLTVSELRCSDLELRLKEKSAAVDSLAKMRRSESVAAEKELERLRDSVNENVRKLSAAERLHQQAVQGKFQVEEALKKAEDALREREGALSKALAELRKLEEHASRYALVKQEKEGHEKVLNQRISQLHEADLLLEKARGELSETKRELRTCSDHCVELEKTLKVKLDDLDRLSRQSKEHAIAAEEQLARRRSEVDALTRRVGLLEGQNVELVSVRAALEKQAQDTASALLGKEAEFESLRREHHLLQDLVEEQKLKLKDFAVVSSEYESLKQKQATEGDISLQRRVESTRKENERLLAKCRGLEKLLAEAMSANAELAQVKEENKVLLERYRVLETSFEDRFASALETERSQFSALLVKQSNMVEDGERFLEGSACKASDAPSAVASTEAVCKKTCELDEPKESSHSQELISLRDKIVAVEGENNGLHLTIAELNGVTHNKDFVAIPKRRIRESDACKFEACVARLETIAKDLLGIDSDRVVNGVVSNDGDDDDFAVIDLCERRLAELCGDFEAVKVRLHDTTKDLGDTKSKLDIFSAQHDDLKREYEELQQQKAKAESDFTYILQSHREEAQTRLASKLSSVEQEKTSLQAKYDQVRLELDKSRREKEHFVATVENLRDDNGKLREQIKRQRMSSTSAVELLVSRLKDEKDALERRCDVLQSTLAKANAENKSLIERISQSEESMTTTIRSLKARKNELQLQLEKCKHEHVVPAKRKQSGEANAERKSLGSFPGFEDGRGSSVMEESLRSAHAKIAELDLSTKEYSKKLRESENLLSELQKALALANDLAMQKSLEGTKAKRNLEKRLEKLLRENAELKQVIATTAQAHIPLSPGRSDSAASLSRLEFSAVGDLRSRADVTSGSPTSSLTNVASSTPLTRQGSCDALRSSRPDSPEASPRMEASRKLERDLTKQLHDLLDTRDARSLPGVGAGNSMGNESVESVGPPKPPPPTNYGLSDRRVKSISESSPEQPVASSRRPSANRGLSGAPSHVTTSRDEFATLLNRWPEFEDLVTQNEAELAKGIVMYRC